MGKIFTITEGVENIGALKTGGQGSVYKGRRKGGIISAIKILPTPIHSESGDDKNYTDFQNEVQKLKKVNEEPNPHVVKILSSGITESGSLPFIEMEFIEGPDIEELLKPPHNSVFTIDEVVKVTKHLSSALAHCHKMGVKHGDIKSNNVKCNINSDNYVLLDFGLAIMSDEQRRSSMRQAGAIEFMAPEQTEGRILFQSDVYSFGIVIFELLAGSVPFPLKEKGETARNKILIAHLEKDPPDLLELRSKALPESWNEEKKLQELAVPDWLLQMVRRCLNKNPESRFADGVELQKFILSNEALQKKNIEVTDQQINLLKLQNERLLLEKESLQQLLSKHQSNNNTIGLSSNIATDKPIKTNPVKKSSFKRYILYALGIIISVSVIVYALINKSEKSAIVPPKKIATQANEFKVNVAKAYFYKQPNASTKLNAYIIPSNQLVKALDAKGDFIYTEASNDGESYKGWIRKQDLSVVEKDALARPVNNEVQVKLNDAKMLLTKNKVSEALLIYKNLLAQKIPEAMYHYGRLALQNRNNTISCKEGFQLIVDAASQGFTPAKRTLGIIHSFADNVALLQSKQLYERCAFTKNTTAGSKYLMEATLDGDTTAMHLLSELNKIGK